MSAPWCLLAKLDAGEACNQKSSGDNRPFIVNTVPGTMVRTVISINWRRGAAGRNAHSKSSVAVASRRWRVALGRNGESPKARWRSQRGQCANRNGAITSTMRASYRPVKPAIGHQRSAALAGPGSAF